MIITHKYLWTIDKTKDTSGTPLQFRVKWNNSHCIATFSPGIRIDADKWSQDAQRCKANTTHTDQCIPANIINKLLAEYESYATTTFNHFQETETMPSVADFKDYFNILRGHAPRKDTSSESIFPYLHMFVEKVGVEHNWAHNTYKTSRSMISCLHRFDDSITTSDTTSAMMHRFQEYLIKNGCRNSYMQKLFKILQTALEWVANSGISINKGFADFKPRLKVQKNSRKRIFLKWDELQKLYNMKFDSILLERTRDVFCFCCFTSLRYSDVAKLQRCDIKNGHIDIVTAKTGDELQIDLNNYSRAILDKYKGQEFGKLKTALPVYANQVMNRYLKTICQIAGFDEPIKSVYYSGGERHEDVVPKYEVISTHCGRHTFIVNALYLGIPSEVVMKWTGHADFKDMLPYIEIVDDLKEREMKKFNVQRANGKRTKKRTISAKSNGF